MLPVNARKVPALCLILSMALSVGSSAAAQPATAPALPTAQAIKACLNSAAGAECLDQLFGEALKTHSTSELMQLIQRLEQDDPELRRDCHPVVHAIGRETYRIKGNIHESFSACDQTCHSGCYHGSVERFLRGEDIYAQIEKHPSARELKQKAAVACDPTLPVRLRFQCLHGLGHALLFFSRYQLLSSLEACDALPEDWSRASCYGGVFMENVVNATPETRDLSPTDYHYPCNKLAGQYRGECYVMQTSRMTEMGLTTEQIFKECDKAGEFRQNCALSVGRDLSNEARIGNSRATAQKCQMVAGDYRHACMRGVVYALIDNTWDGRYALPFCAAFNQDTDQLVCIRLAIEYLAGTFEAAPVEISRQCAEHLPRPGRCADLVAR
jgi:hypothetical protein